MKIIIASTAKGLWPSIYSNGNGSKDTEPYGTVSLSKNTDSAKFGLPMSICFSAEPPLLRDFNSPEIKR